MRHAPSSVTSGLQASPQGSGLPPIAVTSLDLGGDVVFVTDAEGRIVEVNDAFVRVTGYSRQEAIGSTPRLLASGYQDDVFYADLWDTISSGRVWQGQLVDRRRDGALRTHHATITPVHDQHGRITHFVAVERDLTGELGRQAGVGSAGLVHTDASGRCVYADARAAALLERPPAGLLGNGLLARLATEDADALCEVIGMAIERGREHRLDIRTVEGGELAVEIAPLTVSSGAVIGAVLAFDDVSEQLSVHRELARRDAFVTSVLDALDAAVAVVARDGTVLAVNRSWRRASAHDPSSTPLRARVGHNLASILARAAEDGDEAASALQQELARVLTGTPAGPASGALHARVTELAWDEGGAVITFPPATNG